jgi:hypothetical protein
MEIYIGITKTTNETLSNQIEENNQTKDNRLTVEFNDFKNTYTEIIDEINFELEGNNSIEKLISLKRNAINKGPYPNVSLYENSNKILTDLLTLDIVSCLIEKNEYKEIKFNLGNSNKYPFDLITYDKDGKIEFYEISYSTEKGVANKVNSIKNKIKKLNEKEEFKNNNIKICTLFYDFPLNKNLKGCKRNIIIE